MSAFVLMDLAADIGLALLHSLWQITLVAALLWGLRTLLHRASPRLHHALACAALVLTVAWPVATFVRHRLLRGEAVQARQVTSAKRWRFQQPVAEPRVQALLRPLQPAQPWLGLVWVLGVAAMGLRLTGGGLRLRRLGQATCAAPEPLRRLGRELARRMGIRAPELRVAEGAVGPYCLGLFRRVVVLPAACLAHLDAGALEAVLAHEFAHLQRLDYLVNALQCVLELLVFHHPLAWWISSTLRFERERCCDETAVTLCGDARSFAAALLQLDALRPPQPALAAQGAPLSLRLKHLLGAPARPTLFSSLTAALLLGGLLMLAAPTLRGEGSQTIVRAPAALVKLADAAALSEGLDPHLLRAMIQCESRYVPNAKSSAGAMGLLQLLPRTAELMGGGDLADPAMNLKLGSKYLHGLLERFHGNTALAVMAYNAGPEAVEKAEGIAPTAESRVYALAVMDLYRRKAVEADSGK